MSDAQDLEVFWPRQIGPKFNPPEISVSSSSQSFATKVLGHRLRTCRRLHAILPVPLDLHSEPGRRYNCRRLYLTHQLQLLLAKPRYLIPRNDGAPVVSPGHGSTLHATYICIRKPAGINSPTSPSARRYYNIQDADRKPRRDS